MRSKTFKPVIAALLLLVGISSRCFAQDTVAAMRPVAKVQPAVIADVSVSPSPVVVTVRMNKAMRVKLHKLKKQVVVAMNNLNTDIEADLKEVAPQIKLQFKDMDADAAVSVENDSKDDDADEQTKTYTKSYPAGANDMLQIENRYGKVVVNTWDRPEFKVVVEIKVSANNDDDTKRLLDNVTISDSKDGSTVAFKTNIGSDNNNSSWTSWFHTGRNVRKMEINYTVFMPAKNGLNVDNRYGPIDLPDIDGKVTVYSAYGSLTAKALSNQDNITVRYGSAGIVSLGTADLQVAYGSLQLGSVDKLNADVSYSSADIGKIHVSGNINLKYSGGLKIADIDKNMQSLTINASYSNVNLGLSGDENANFDITTHYGGFDYDDQNATITSKSPSDDERGPHFTYHYKGYLGKGGTDKNISVNVNYGSVKFE